MEIKKIMLIKPGRRYGGMGYGQPLGLLFLISILRRRFPGKYEIDFVEQALYDLDNDTLMARFRKFDPDLVGFSACSIEAGEMEAAAKVIKQLKPACKTVLGGPHASFFFDWALKSGNIDLVVMNEGETTFPELLEALEQDRPLEAVKGLAFMKDGQPFQTPEREFIEDLDSLPLPAWDLIDFSRYSRQITMNGYYHSAPWAMIFTTRACPFKCAYCHCLFGKKVRKRSVENVLAEIELLTQKYGVKELHIVDDIFNIDLDRAKKICDEIVARKIKVKICFPNGIRADMMDRELIRKLKAAGCYCITYAVETASPRLQKLISKNLDLEKTKQVIAWTYDEGIITQAFTMLGFPTESLDELKMTVDYALDAKLLRVFFFTVVVYPRTELLEIAKKSYPDFDFSGYDWFDLLYWSQTPFYSRVTPYDGFKIQRNAYRRFYFRPHIIFNIIRRFPKNRTLLLGIWWGLRASFPILFKIQAAFRPVRKFLHQHLGLFSE